MTTLTLTKPSLIPPNYNTKYSYKAPSYMELARFTIEAKKFHYYELANIAFVCLLRLSINPSVTLTWQSTNKQLNDSYEAALANANKDLIVVSNNRLIVNMPVTLLTPQYMKYVYLNATKEIVAPKDRWSHPPRPNKLILAGQLDYLKNKLALLVPNHKELASRYLQPKP